MLMTLKRHARSAALIAVAAALTVGGVALAQGSGGGSSRPNTSNHPPPGLGPGGPPGGGAIAMGPAAPDLTWGELHVRKNGNEEVIRVDAGKVVSTDASSITLQENDGSQVTIPVDGQTRVLAGPGRSQSISQLKGEMVVVHRPEGKAAEAIMVLPKPGDMPKPPPGAPRRGPGEHLFHRGP